jgi:hypothetical protein
VLVSKQILEKLNECFKLIGEQPLGVRQSLGVDNEASDSTGHRSAFLHAELR